MSKIRLGIIGCGIAAKKLHWPALQQLEDHFEITAVCNHTEPKAKEFAEMVGGVPYFLDYRQLLKRREVEAAIILLPIPLNYPVTKQALSAGKHVMVEKPLAKNLAEAKKMLQLDRNYDRITMVAENFRYRQTFYKMQELIQYGRIGKVHSVSWNVCSLVNEKNPYAQTQWRINHQYPGGFITDGGVHQIAALRFLFGEILSGSAMINSVNPVIGEMDHLNFHFKTDRKINGCLNLNYAAHGYSENKLVVFGERGTLVTEDNVITIKADEKEDEQITVEDDGGYKGQYEDFYQSIRRGSPVVSTFEEGYRDLKTILTAINSDKKLTKFTIEE